jgi:hypothetical protein
MTAPAVAAVVVVCLLNAAVGWLSAWVGGRVRLTPPHLWDLFSLIWEPLPTSPALLTRLLTETRIVQLHLRQRTAVLALQGAVLGTFPSKQEVGGGVCMS